MPWPSVVVAVAHEWEPVACSGCGDSIGTVASFDASRVAESSIFCSACLTWCEIRCSRCRLPLGSTTTPHQGALIYCGPCAALDRQAAEQLEDRETASVTLVAEKRERTLPQDRRSRAPATQDTEENAPW